MRILFERNGPKAPVMVSVIVSDDLLNVQARPATQDDAKAWPMAYRAFIDDEVRRGNNVSNIKLPKPEGDTTLAEQKKALADKRAGRAS